MNLNETLRGLLDGALAGNLTDEDRRRLTVLWVVAKALPTDALIEDVLAAGSWVLDLADVEGLVEYEEADHTPRHSTGDVDERFVPATPPVVDLRDGHLR